MSEVDLSVPLGFLVGDVELVRVERWLYDTPELEQLWGEPCYLELICRDFRGRSAAYELGRELKRLIPASELQEYERRRILSLLVAGGERGEWALSECWDLYSEGWHAIAEIALASLENVRLPEWVQAKALEMLSAMEPTQADGPGMMDGGAPTH